MTRLEWPEKCWPYRQDSEHLLPFAPVAKALHALVQTILGKGCESGADWYWGTEKKPFFWVLHPGDMNEVTKPDKVLFYGSWGDETHSWEKDAFWLEYGPETPIDREAIEKLIREVQILAAE